MEILKQYNEDTLELISDGQSYLLPNFDSNIHIIKLSVFSDVGSFLENEDLEQDVDFYISNGQIFLKQDVIRYEAPKPDFVKPARRFVYIEPAFRQIIFPDGTVTGPPSVDTLKRIECYLGWYRRLIHDLSREACAIC